MGIQNPTKKGVEGFEMNGEKQVDGSKTDLGQ